jgi:hypothetical protein
LAGLGATLAAAGRPERGAALLERALAALDARVETTAKKGDLEGARALGAGRPRIVLDLARTLAEKMGDRPAAIARARAVPHDIDVKTALEARGLEGRWRAELGDAAGASLAFARMRDRANALGDAAGAGATAGSDVAILLLFEAARFEEARGELTQVQQHFATAIRLRPHDRAVQQAYRGACAAVKAKAGVHDPAFEENEVHTRDDVALAPAAEAPAAGARAAIAPAAPAPARAAPAPATPAPISDGPLGPEEEAQAAQRVEELTRRLQADPTDDSVVDELVVLLTRLGRGHELLALLSARLEDAPSERRATLIPKQRAVLARLEREALAEGRALEAELFKIAREAL